MAGDHVLVAGEALVDVRVEDGHRSEHPGGSPLNVAVGLARLGVPTTLATQLGDDAHGRLVAAHVEASGVQLVRLPPHGTTATATARLEAGGGATYEFDIDWDPVRLPDPGGFRLVHVGSIGATLPPGAGGVVALTREASSAGVPVSVDPNLRPSITPDLDQARTYVQQVIELASVVKLSDEDAEVLWPGREPHSVLDTLSGAPGAPLVAMTRGGEGAVLAAGGRRGRAPARPVEVSDTIGAGDSFMAALLAGLLVHDLADPAGWTAAALDWLTGVAVEAAAVTCSRPGADPPWASELPALADGPVPAG